MIEIVISIIIFILFSLLLYVILNSYGITKVKNKINLRENKIYTKFGDYIVLLTKKELVPKRMKFKSPLILVGIMTLLFIASFLLFYTYLDVISTSLILSIPFFISPLIIIKIVLNQEKSKIRKILPMYAVNIKNHVSEDNNIIKAIQMTLVEEPLAKYISAFKGEIARGINVIDAFETLKKEVDVPDFDNLINACEVCFLNGGDFVKVLDQYINIITKENLNNEETKEKAYSDILTLIIMIVLNIFVIVMFVFANKDYAAIIKETFVGRAILNFNAISYIIIAYLISRVYKEG